MGWLRVNDRLQGHALWTTLHLAYNLRLTRSLILQVVFNLDGNHGNHGNHGVQRGVEVAGIREWNHKEQKAYGICISLYEQHPYQQDNVGYVCKYLS
jgi:hypothetical protein